MDYSLLTTREVAELLRISEEAVIRLVDARYLKPRHIPPTGIRRQRRYRKDEVLTFLKENAPQVAQIRKREQRNTPTLE